MRRLLFHIVLVLIVATLVAGTRPNPEAEPHRYPVSARNAPLDLKVLPLGDSITLGERSTHGNGYRLRLLNKLSPTYHVTYIGSQASGSMKNNRHEGHGGFSIEQVAATAPQNYPDDPDVVLLMAGTNNFIFDIDVEHAPRTMHNLIRNITAFCPDTTVIVGTCPVLLRPGKGKLVAEFNEALRGVVRGLADSGKKVALADMKMVGPDQIHQDDLIHPTDEGYRIIAGTWFDAIIESAQAGFIEAPESWAAGERLGLLLAGSMALVVAAAYGVRRIVASRATYRPVPPSKGRYPYL